MLFKWTPHLVSWLLEFTVHSIVKAIAPLPKTSPTVPQNVIIYTWHTRPFTTDSGLTAQLHHRFYLSLCPSRIELLVVTGSAILSYMLLIL